MGDWEGNCQVLKATFSISSPSPALPWWGLRKMRFLDHNLQRILHNPLGYVSDFNIVLNQLLFF